MAQPEYHWIGFRFFVFHGGVYMTEGAKYGVPGVSIVISQEIEEGKWFAHSNITTDKIGEASIHLGGPGKTGNWHFGFHKTGYEDAEITGHYEEQEDHSFEKPLHEIGWEPEGVKEKEIQLAWNAQTEIEKIAMSFISALAVIMAFKVLQGFSMERINPVA